MFLFACDLDNTLIFSYKRLTGEAVCVEKKDGKALSYMRPGACEMLRQLVRQVQFVPVTTRSIEQYERITLPCGVPSYALVDNGGTLLVHGAPDEQWRAETMRLIAPARSALEEGLALLEKDTDVTLAPRLTDGLFVFAKTKNFERSAARLRAALHSQQVKVERVGEKIYILPAPLEKGQALCRLWQRLQPDVVAAAGDSSFDIPMLKVADYAVFPQHDDLLHALKTHPCATAIQTEPADFAPALLSHIGGLAAAFFAQQETVSPQNRKEMI